MLLKNREDAAIQLAELLKSYKDKNALILACSGNAVETAYHLANKLNAEFSMLMITELSYPGHTEYSFGALCEGDTIYVDDSRHLLTDNLIMNIVIREKKALLERANIFRNGRSLPVIKNRIVILVDDTLITGLSFVPAIRLCESLNASRVVVGVPVGSLVFHKHINDADELRVVHQYTGLSDPREVYSLYENLPDTEIKKLLELRQLNNQLNNN